MIGLLKTKPCDPLRPRSVRPCHGGVADCRTPEAPRRTRIASDAVSQTASGPEFLGWPPSLPKPRLSAKPVKEEVSFFVGSLTPKSGAGGEVYSNIIPSQIQTKYSSLFIK